MSVEKLLLSDDSVKRREGVCLLGHNPDAIYLSELLRLLKTDPSPVVRHEVAFVLTKFQHYEGVISSLIEAALCDTSDLVVHEAAESLGDINVPNEQVVCTLARLQHSSNAFIRDTADIALRKLDLKKQKLI